MSLASSRKHTTTLRRSPSTRLSVVRVAVCATDRTALKGLERNRFLVSIRSLICSMAVPREADSDQDRWDDQQLQHVPEGLGWLHLFALRTAGRAWLRTSESPTGLRSTLLRAVVLLSW